MRQLKRVFKPLLATAVIGAGGYYLYDTLKVQNHEQFQIKPATNSQILPTKHEPRNHQKQEDLDLQKLKSRESSQTQKTVIQQSNNENKQSSKIEKAQESQKKSNSSNQQPKTQNLPSSEEKPQSSVQSSSRSNSPIDLTKIKRLSQLPQLPLKPKSELKTILIVADMGYTQQFQQKLLETIRSLRKLPSLSSIQIYRTNTSSPQSISQLSQHYNYKIKQQTIFLLKNQLQDNFIDISFDMYMQYPTLISTYLTKMNLYNMENQSEYMKMLEKMSPNESYLMFVYDDAQSSDKKAKALLAAKYIEMELALQHLDQAIKVVPVEVTVVRDKKLIPEDKIRSKSIHIIRKHNEFTHVAPNLYLKFDNEITPYHLLPDIGLHNKRGQVAIQQYLQKIQTFNSLSITTPFLLSLTIDKNRVSTQNYKKLMDTFKEIKRKNKFPQVSIALKFAQVGYLGKNQHENSEFCIKMANIAELQNQSAVHEITNIEDAKNMGITEQNWLKNSYEFLYPHQAVSQELIEAFIAKVLLNEIPQYYRSDKPSSIQNVHKIVASNFDQQILQNSLDHFVFQYSDHCPSCKLISPLIAYMNDILSPIPIQQRFDIHVMNCHKNRVKGQVYSPYTPNMNYFKSEWKHTGPVRIGLQTIKYGGLEGLYNFCIITNMLKTIDGKKFSEALDSAKGWNKAEFLL